MATFEVLRCGIAGGPFSLSPQGPYRRPASDFAKSSRERGISFVPTVRVESVSRAARLNVASVHAHMGELPTGCVC
jgi:hypothetical protein